MSFGETIRYRRKMAGFSQRRMAFRLKITPTYLSKIERGELPPPSAEMIIKIAAETGLSADFLFALAKKIPPDVQQILLRDVMTWAEVIRSLDAFDGDQK
jgi:transcriptional regulator with XRE-family HTH domain